METALGLPSGMISSDPQAPQHGFGFLSVAIVELMSATPIMMAPIKGCTKNSTPRPMMNSPAEPQSLRRFFTPNPTLWQVTQMWVGGFPVKAESSPRQIAAANPFFGADGANPWPQAGQLITVPSAFSTTSADVHLGQAMFMAGKRGAAGC